MSVILGVLSDAGMSKSNSLDTNFLQKRTLNLQNTCLVCSSTQQTCSHRWKGCPDHPSAVLVQDFNHHDYLCSVCGCILSSDINFVINKRCKTLHESVVDQHCITSTTDSTNTTSNLMHSTLLKQPQDPLTTQSSVSQTQKTNDLQSVQNQVRTVSPSTTTTPTTLSTTVVTEPAKLISPQPLTRVPDVVLNPSHLTLLPPKVTKISKPRKKSIPKQKKAAALMKQQLITEQSEPPVDNNIAEPLQQECNTTVKSTSPADPLVEIKEEPIDSDDISVTATTLGNSNIPALAPWPYKLEQIDAGNSNTSTPTTETNNASKKKLSFAATKAIQSGIARMEHFANGINAPMSLVQNASALFKKVYESGVLRNRPIDVIVSTCLHITCRQEGAPRTFLEISQISKVSKKELGRTFKTIVKFIDAPIDIITTKDFMCRFCHILGLAIELSEAAQHIAIEAAKLDLVAGRSPVSVAAVCIYVATQASSQPRSSADIAAATGVSEVTIISLYRCIYPYAKELFPPNFRFHTSIENLPAHRISLL